MNSTTYRTGSWLCIARSGSVIVLEAATDPATVTALWDYLGAQTPTIHGVLNAVTGRFGTDLTAMPQFAILVQSDRLHVILRGEISLVASTADIEDLVSGRDVTTWSERSLVLPDFWELSLQDAGTASQDALPEALPLGEAVVRLRELTRESAPASRAVPALPLAPPAAQDRAEADPAGPLTFEAVHGASVDEPLDLDSIYDAPAAVDAEGEAHHDVDTADDDAYAGFALAADAEWTAQLAEPTGSQPAIETSNVPEGESDLDRTIFPDHGQDDEPAYRAPDAEAAPFAGYDPADAELPEVDGGTNGGDDVEDGTDFDTDLGDFSYAEPDAAEPGDSLDDSAPAGAREPDLDGFTTDYDHLFGATELRSVEDAAVRFDDDGHELPKDDAGLVPPPPAMPPAVGSYAPKPADEDALEPSEPGASEEQPWQPPSGLLIDSVPWGNHDTPASHETPSAVTDDGDPDHDGQTILRSDLPQTPEAASEQDDRPSTGPMVLARLCPQGHANPPSHSLCSECGAAINSEPREMSRPRLGRMHVSTGEVLGLDHSLIIGRQPSVSRVLGGVMPRLVQVQSASGDISRSHVEVRLDGWDVLLVDLKATNGTVLIREGQAPRRLGQGEEAILLNGDIAELGDGVSLLFEGLP
ncbi:FHA domain-containing protein [Arthrobacter sp. GMC3]|uniref:FHA domain-containing protein n=1 Tax=Arthrobacter sp. GMC3 TaxID=2058894 RepID=UPI0015E496A0|nr:FHA domain-containing protein [Arthrobacter sp. GMC3]